MPTWWRQKFRALGKDVNMVETKIQGIREGCQHGVDKVSGP